MLEHVIDEASTNTIYEKFLSKIPPQMNDEKELYGC
jgi:hypothetical protein